MPLFSLGLVKEYLRVEEKYIQLNKIVSFVRIIRAIISYNYCNKLLKFMKKHYIRKFFNDLSYVNVSKIAFMRERKQYSFSSFNTKYISYMLLICI